MKNLFNIALSMIRLSMSSALLRAIARTVFLMCFLCSCSHQSLQYMRPAYSRSYLMARSCVRIDVAWCILSRFPELHVSFRTCHNGAMPRSSLPAHGAFSFDSSEKPIDFLLRYLCSRKVHYPIVRFPYMGALSYMYHLMAHSSFCCLCLLFRWVYFRNVFARVRNVSTSHH